MSDFEAVVLGSGGCHPTKNRNATSIYCRCGCESYLVDIAEGSQRQILKNNLGLFVDFIVITHNHLDHWKGLIGYLHTCKLLHRVAPLSIYCVDPSFFTKIINYTAVENSDFFKTCGFQINFIKIQPCVQYVHSSFTIRFFKVDHTILCYGLQVTSMNNESYNKSKLQSWGTQDQIAQLIKNGVYEKDSKVYRSADFIDSTDPHYNVVFSGDTSIKNEIWDSRSKEKRLVFHQCTYMFPDDLPLGALKKHTHLQQIVQKMKSHPDTSVILMHFGPKISPDMFKNIKYPRIYDSIDGCRIRYNSKKNVLEVSK